MFGGTYAKDLESLKKVKRFYFKGGEYVKNADTYLKGVKRESVDFIELIEKYRHIAMNENKILFLILDPPYLQTSIEHYNMNYYSLSQFLNMIDLIQKPYIMFSSDKSDIFAAIEYFQKKFNYFSGIKSFRFNNSMGSVDNCFYEF